MYNHKITYRNPNRKPYGWKEPTAKEYKRLYRQNPKGWKELGRSMAKLGRLSKNELNEIKADIKELTAYIKDLGERIDKEQDPEKKKALQEEAGQVLKANRETVKNIYSALDKVTNKVMSGIVGAHNIKVGTLNGEDVTVYVVTDYRYVDGAERLDKVEKSTLDAIHSAFMAGNNFISFDHLNRIKHGGRDVKLTKKEKEKLIKELKIMMTTFVTIDNENEAIAYNRPHIEKTTTAIKGTIIKAEVWGRKASGFLIQECILLEYAQACGQLSTIPVKMLDTPLNASKKNTRLRDYLLSRILRIKGGKARHKRILFDAICKNVLNIEGKPTRSQQVQINRLKESVKVLLDFWREQALYNNYSISKDGITIY